MICFFIITNLIILYFPIMENFIFDALNNPKIYLEIMKI